MERGRKEAREGCRDEGKEGGRGLEGGENEEAREGGRKGREEVRKGKELRQEGMERERKGIGERGSNGKGGGVCLKERKPVCDRGERDRHSE